MHLVQLLGWALMPLVAFGIDETVDPQRFALLPLSHPGPCNAACSVTSLVGYLPVANVIVMVGAVIGVSIPWWTLPIALVGGRTATPDRVWCCPGHCPPPCRR